MTDTSLPEIDCGTMRGPAELANTLRDSEMPVLLKSGNVRLRVTAETRLATIHALLFASEMHAQSTLR